MFVRLGGDRWGLHDRDSLRAYTPRAAGSSAALTSAKIPAITPSEPLVFQSLNGRMGLPHGGPRAQRCRTNAMPSATPFLIMLCSGVADTLAWQSYGNAARQIITSKPTTIRRRALIESRRCPTARSSSSSGRERHRCLRTNRRNRVAAQTITSG